MTDNTTDTEEKIARKYTYRIQKLSREREIHYERVHDTGQVEVCILKMQTPPQPKLYEILDRFAPLIVEDHMLGDDWHQGEITRINFKQEGGQTSFHCTLKLKLEDRGTHIVNSNVFSAETAAGLQYQVNDLLEEIKIYLEASCSTIEAQLELFNQDYAEQSIEPDGDGEDEGEDANVFLLEPGAEAVALDEDDPDGNTDEERNILTLIKGGREADLTLV